MTPLYQEHPTMFADEPGRFIGLVIVIVAPLVIGAFFPSFFLYLLPITVIGLAIIGWWFLLNRSTIVTVTDERITLRRGVFAKENIEVEVGSIRTVRVDQTFVDRIFNCGILKVFTAGDQPDINQDGLPDPNRLRLALRRAREVE